MQPTTKAPIKKYVNHTDYDWAKLVRCIDTTPRLRQQLILRCLRGNQYIRFTVLSLAEDCGFQPFEMRKEGL
jgi:hypothetical protein